MKNQVIDILEDINPGVDYASTSSIRAASIR